MSAAPSPIPRTGRLRSLVATMSLSVLVAGGLTLAGPQAAHAAEGFHQTVHTQFVFDSPSGTDWVVPNGVTVVYVGLRGGDGGNAARAYPNDRGGHGDNMVLRVPVTPGDRLTLYAGKTATGKTSDQRDGGLGYRPGGDGGKGSVDGKNAGGGGGAAALLINGTPVAVAAGGGGNGGNGGNGNGHGSGGLGGNAGAVRTPGTRGEGSVPGAGAGDTLLTGSLSQTRGAHGGNAENSSASGGGGGGGGGWESGESGHGGRRSGGVLYGNSGGGGGAPGLSMVSSSRYTRVTEAETDPQDYSTYRGPVAQPGTVKVVIPQTVGIQLWVPPTVEADLPVTYIQVEPRTSSGALIGGSVDLVVDGGTRIGTYTSENQRRNYIGPYYEDNVRFSEGTHTLKASYRSSIRSGDFDYPEERATTTATFRALPLLKGSLSVTGTAVAGQTLTADVSRLTGNGTPLGELSYRWWRDNKVISGATGAGYTVTPDDTGRALHVQVSAANYWGSKDSSPTSVRWEPQLTLTTTPSGTLTLPGDLRVTATLTSPALVPDGSAVELSVDGVPFGTDRTKDTTATFTLTDLAAGSHTLTAVYNGDSRNTRVESTVDVTVKPAALRYKAPSNHGELEDPAASHNQTPNGHGELEDPAASHNQTPNGHGELDDPAASHNQTPNGHGELDDPAASHNQTPSNHGELDDPPSSSTTDLSGATVNLVAGPYLYAGSPIEPAVTSVTLPDGTGVTSAGYTVSYGPNTAAGTGTVTVTGQGSYLGTVTTSFTIDPLAVTITADDEVKTVGEDDPELNWDADPALAPGDTLAGSLAYTGTAVGEYPITQGSLDLSNPNYVFTFVPGTMTITPSNAVIDAWTQIVLLPDPIVTLADADRVAKATNAVAALTDEERGQLPADELAALATAQQQAGPVNQNDLEDGILSASDELADHWNLRLSVIPRTWDGSYDVYSRIAEALWPLNEIALALYDLSFVDTLTGEPWQPTEPVTIKLTELDLTDVKKVGVRHELPDGTLEAVPVTVESGVVSFTATSFSHYVATSEFETASSQPDTDGDGIPNSEDPDIDGDGIPNGQDDDVDGDGIPNAHDGDTDGDGIIDANDPDVDGDGIPNGQDPDIDGDGIPNAEDPDMDGDGIPNGQDWDENGDGIPEDGGPGIGLGDTPGTPGGNPGGNGTPGTDPTPTPSSPSGNGTPGTDPTPTPSNPSGNGTPGTDPSKTPVHQGGGTTPGSDSGKTPGAKGSGSNGKLATTGASGVTTWLGLGGLLLVTGVGAVCLARFRRSSTLSSPRDDSM